jgi:hypothetical protein
VAGLARFQQRTAVMNERNPTGKHRESTRKEATLTLRDVVAGSYALFLSFILRHAAVMSNRLLEGPPGLSLLQKV